MKYSIIVGIVAAFIFSSGCSKSEPRTRESATPTPVKDLVAQSQIIAYTSADTNNAPHLGLIVIEILKGKQEASTFGITNGMRFPYEYPKGVRHLPDGAFIFIKPEEISATGVKYSSLYWVKEGRVKDMTVQQFKTSCGL